MASHDLDLIRPLGPPSPLIPAHLNITAIVLLTRLDRGDAVHDGLGLDLQLLARGARCRRRPGTGLLKNGLGGGGVRVGVAGGLVGAVALDVHAGVSGSWGDGRGRDGSSGCNGDGGSLERERGPTGLGGGRDAEGQLWLGDGCSGIHVYLFGWWCNKKKDCFICF